MIKMVIFDLDGTLANSLADLALNVNKGLKAAGLPERPVADYRNYVGNGRVTLVKRAMGDAASDHVKFNVVISTFNREYNIHCNDHTVAYDGCADMLKGLSDKGIRTAVLSNKPDEFVEKIMSELYPEHRFTAVWGQKPQYNCKPDGESLRSMLWLYNLAPADCIYVGDSDVDVYTARDAGVRMAGVSWGFRGKEELQAAGAPYVADTAGELLDYLLTL